MAITWKHSSEIAGVAALAAGDAAGMVAAANPSFFTMRAFRSVGAHAERTAKDIHIGMVVGSALALAVGFGTTAMTESWWPLAATVGTLIVLDVMAEWALNHPHNMHKDISDQ